MLKIRRAFLFVHSGRSVCRAGLVMLMVFVLSQPTQVKGSQGSEPYSVRATIPLVMTPQPIPDGQRYVIGYSVGSRPIDVYRFGRGQRNKLILAAIHGGYEWNTMELAHMLKNHLLDNPGMVPEDQTLYILPLLNPDGEARSYGEAGRPNDHGVDINRNFDANWKSSWYNVGCWDYYHPNIPISAGSQPFSEPESAALRDFVLSNKIEALISYHSSGHEIYAGGVPPDPHSLSLALALEHASGYDYPPHSSPCEMTGQLIDWASAQGIAAVDVELTYHQDIDYEPNERMLEAFIQWSKSE